MVIKLTKVRGEYPIFYINATHIESIHPINAGTLILMVSSDSIFVKETPEEIFLKIKEGETDGK